jgi:hypothetical protein
MTEEIQQQEPVAEDFVDEQPEVAEQPRTVPLEALEAERRKRQDSEAQLRVLQDMMKSPPKEVDQDESEDDDEFITKAEMNARLKKATFSQKREVLEEAFCDSKPEAVELINKHLKEIITKKP